MPRRKAAAFSFKMGFNKFNQTDFINRILSENNGDGLESSANRKLRSVGNSSSSERSKLAELSENVMKVKCGETSNDQTSKNNDENCSKTCRVKAISNWKLGNNDHKEFEDEDESMEEPEISLVSKKPLDDFMQQNELVTTKSDNDNFWTNGFPFAAIESLLSEDQKDEEKTGESDQSSNELNDSKRQARAAVDAEKLMKSAGGAGWYREPRTCQLCNAFTTYRTNKMQWHLKARHNIGRISDVFNKDGTVKPLSSLKCAQRPRIIRQQTRIKQPKVVVLAKSYRRRPRYTVPRTCPYCPQFSTHIPNTLLSHLRNKHGLKRISDVFSYDGKLLVDVECGEMKTAAHCSTAAVRTPSNKKLAIQNKKSLSKSLHNLYFAAPRYCPYGCVGFFTHSSTSLRRHLENRHGRRQISATNGKGKRLKEIIRNLPKRKKDRLNTMEHSAEKSKHISLSQILEKPLSCHICTRFVSKSRRLLFRHLASQHGVKGEIVSSLSDSDECASSKTKVISREHSRKDIVHRCPHCAHFSTRYSFNLNRHLRRTHGKSNINAKRNKPRLIRRESRQTSAFKQMQGQKRIPLKLPYLRHNYKYKTPQRCPLCTLKTEFLYRTSMHKHLKRRHGCGHADVFDADGFVKERWVLKLKSKRAHKRVVVDADENENDVIKLEQKMDYDENENDVIKLDQKMDYDEIDVEHEDVRSEALSMKDGGDSSIELMTQQTNDEEQQCMRELEGKETARASLVHDEFVQVDDDPVETTEYVNPSLESGMDFGEYAVTDSVDEIYQSKQQQHEEFGEMVVDECFGCHEEVEDEYAAAAIMENNMILCEQLMPMSPLSSFSAADDDEDEDIDVVGGFQDDDSHFLCQSAVSGQQMGSDFVACSFLSSLPPLLERHDKNEENDDDDGITSNLTNHPCSPLIAYGENVQQMAEEGNGIFIAANESIKFANDENVEASTFSPNDEKSAVSRFNDLLHNTKRDLDLLEEAEILPIGKGGNVADLFLNVDDQPAEQECESDSDDEQQNLNQLLLEPVDAEAIFAAVTRSQLRLLSALLEQRANPPCPATTTTTEPRRNDVFITLCSDTELDENEDNKDTVWQHARKTMRTASNSTSLFSPGEGSGGDLGSSSMEISGLNGDSRRVSSNSSGILTTTTEPAADASGFLSTTGVVDASLATASNSTQAQETNFTQPQGLLLPQFPFFHQQQSIQSPLVGYGHFPHPQLLSVGGITPSPLFGAAAGFPPTTIGGGERMPLAWTAAQQPILFAFQYPHFATGAAHLPPPPPQHFSPAMNGVGDGQPNNNNVVHRHVQQLPTTTASAQPIFFVLPSTTAAPTAFSFGQHYHPQQQFQLHQQQMMTTPMTSTSSSALDLNQSIEVASLAPREEKQPECADTPRSSLIMQPTITNQPQDGEDEMVGAGDQDQPQLLLMLDPNAATSDD